MHKNNHFMTKSGNGLLSFAVSSEPIASVVFDGLRKDFRMNGDTDVVVAVPKKWAIEPSVTSPRIECYGEKIALFTEHLRPTKRNLWFVISNGRFATHIDGDLLDKVLTRIEADVVAVNVTPDLLAHHEKVLLTAQGKVAGFRRQYSDSAEPAPFPTDWPHHIFLKTDVVNQILTDHTLPVAFSKFINICSSNSMTVRCINMGGTALDLGIEKGLLSVIATGLNSSVKNHHNANNKYQQELLDRDGVQISPSARLFGKVLFGQNVSISQNAIVAGPSIICNDVKIANGAVIRTSIIGPGVSVPRNHIIQNRVLRGHSPKRKIVCLGSYPQRRQKHRRQNANSIMSLEKSCSNNFRTWPKFSYAGCLKRIADVVAAVIVLILFAPIIPLIALVIKLTSPGPVFFKDKRQGLHGKAFECIKFRTMLVGADKIQDKLRIVSQVDGPQFKMTDDPRLSTVGRFLRNTYIDEIPQFFNVLFGQMSVVGPRPSPESENTLCPSWRDARLSVRPGITGLWQVCRTRQPMKDFQEWIHYDTRYVRDLSLWMDLWICLQTTRKLVKNFVSQF